jgi:hypothetical protein
MKKLFLFLLIFISFISVAFSFDLKTLKPIDSYVIDKA